LEPSSTLRMSDLLKSARCLGLLFDCGLSLVLAPKVSEDDEFSRVEVACFVELFVCRCYALEIMAHSACFFFLEELLRFLVDLRSHLWPELALLLLHVDPQ